MIAGAVQAALDAANVPYCLIGAHALAAHGAARYTADVDLLTMRGVVCEPDFWPEALKPQLRRGDEGDPLAGVVRFEAPPVDLIVGRGRLMAEAVADAVFVEGVGCRVVTAVGLALLKLEAGGVQDLSDVELLLAARALDGDDLRAAIEGRVPSLSAWGRRAWDKVVARLDDEG